MNQGTKADIDAASNEAAAENQTAAKSETEGNVPEPLGTPGNPLMTPAVDATASAASTGANEGQAQSNGELVARIEVRKLGGKYLTVASTDESIFPAHETSDVQEVIGFTEGFLREKAAA